MSSQDPKSSTTESPRFKAFDAVGGHASKDVKQHAMFAKQGRVYKAWQPIAQKELDEGRTRGRGELESEFYIEAWGMVSTHARTADKPPEAGNQEEALHPLVKEGFLARYFGVEEVELPLLVCSDATNAATLSSDATGPNTASAIGSPKNKKHKYIVLEDITHGLGDAVCLLDCKIGQRTYDELAGPRKIASATANYSKQEEFGFRICGLKAVDRIFVPPQAEGFVAGEQQVRRDGAWGKTLLSEESLMEGLKLFFPPCTSFGPVVNADAGKNSNSANGSSRERSRSPTRVEETSDKCEDHHIGVHIFKRTELVDVVLGKLRRMLEIFEHHPRWRIYSASILIAYDARRPVASLRMMLIDFAHVFRIDPLKDKGTNLEKDYNFIYGLKSLIEVLEKMKKRF